MAEKDEWHARYRRLVREFDDAERAWRELEHVLRRVIGRLCSVARDGTRGQLEQSLTALGKASKGGLGQVLPAEGWARLCEELDACMISLQRGDRATEPLQPPAQTTGQTPWQAAISAMARLLRALAGEFGGEAGPEELIKTLTGELESATTDSALAAIIERTAALVSERAGRLAQQRLETAELLARMTCKLEAVSGFVGESMQDRRSMLVDANDLSIAVTRQVRQMSADVAASMDLGVLKAHIGPRLAEISGQVNAFQQREQERCTQYQRRTEQMNARLLQLEQKAHELHRALDDERQRARIDVLTGLANRLAFDEQIAAETARCARERVTMSVLLWDIDHFKAINDRHGHRVGDGALREVARCLVRGLRSEDLIARIGGEEFSALLLGAKLEDALARAEQLRVAVEQLKLHVHGTPLRLTVSCGATEIRPTDTVESLFDRADKALYRAKESGRNLCVAA
jgi:diguanylate cyclase